MAMRFIGSLLMIGFAGALLWLERRRPLRRRVDPGPRRLARNFSMATATAMVISAAERPVVERLTRAVEAKRWGLVPRLGMPPWLALGACVVLLDYTLYLWHVLLHRLPFLWRLHLAHHVDLDLDASTAVRFHFGEFLASVPWRAAQVVLIGVGPRELALWRKLALAEVFFHHANLRLAPRLERRLAWLVMTPRLHGIHHSMLREERDSNFSSGLTVWDYLHGTIRTDVPQERITIGVAPYAKRSEVTLGRTLALPFVGADAPQASSAPATLATTEGS